MQFDHPAQRLEGIEFTELNSNPTPVLLNFDQSLGCPAVESDLKIDDVVVAGDQVAVCVPRGLPQAREILDALVRRLLRLDLAGVDLVFAPGSSQELIAWANSQFGSEVDASVHDGQRRSEVAFVAADQDANPLYLAKRLVEADCVIPIEVSRSSMASTGASWIYPVLADTDAQSRWYCGPVEAESGGESGADSSEHDADQAACSFREIPDIPWHLGVMFWLQVVVNDDGKVSELSGRFRHESIDRSGELSKSDARVEAEGLFDLVIASMDGDPREQDLEDLLTVARNAAVWLAEEGTLLICTGLTEFPIRREMIEEAKHDPSAGGQHGDRTEESPFLPIDRIAELGRQWRDLLESRRVVVCGDAGVARWAEEWEMTVLSNDEEVRRLARGMNSIAVLRAAHWFPDPRLPFLSLAQST